MAKISTLILFTLVLSTFLKSCVSNSSGNDSLSSFLSYKEEAIRTGGVKIIPIQTQKGKFNLWTKRIGNNPQKRLLLLAGGPGCSSEYFECFESFIPKEGIEMIYYDQLGCGKSDNPNDTSLWDLTRYVEEVELVRKSLELDSSNFILLGHSWGGILAMEFALKYQQNMKALIISNMMSDGMAYDKYAEEVLSKQMDPSILDSIKMFEKTGTTSDPRFMELLLPHYYNKHICRIPLEEWPNAVNRTFASLNMSLYVTMQGPSEFGLSGKLENWNISNRLKEIVIPTLVVGAQHDTMDPKHMEWMSQQIKKATFLLCNGSHMSMWDDQEKYMGGVVKFIKNL